MVVGRGWGEKEMASWHLMMAWHLGGEWWKSLEMSTADDGSPTMWMYSVPLCTFKKAQTVDFKLRIFEHTHTPYPTCGGNILKHWGAEKPARVCAKAPKTKSRGTHTWGGLHVFLWQRVWSLTPFGEQLVKNKAGASSWRILLAMLRNVSCRYKAPGRHWKVSSREQRNHIWTIRWTLWLRVGDGGQWERGSWEEGSKASGHHLGESWCRHNICVAEVKEEEQKKKTEWMKLKCQRRAV